MRQLQAHEVQGTQRFPQSQSDWQDLYRRMRACGLFLQVLPASPAAAKSCQHELALAEKLDMDILLLRFDKAAQVPARGENTRCLDLRLPLSAAHAARLRNAVLRHERQEQQSYRQQAKGTPDQEDSAQSRWLQAGPSSVAAPPMPYSKGMRASRAYIAETAAEASAAALPAARPNGKHNGTRSRRVGITRGALPALEWCEIPAGQVTLARQKGADEPFDEKTIALERFFMSKYPVSNAQFRPFVQAADGYHDPRWWAFSPHAKAWYQQEHSRAGHDFSEDSLPCHRVSWYEAVAYCLWMSRRLGRRLALPSLAQWQRAAKGDDERYFPWGDDYLPERCNTQEAGLKRHSAVDRYPQGKSPFGVFDMVGNVWEWTHSSAPAAEAGQDRRRAIVGGSYRTDCTRAQTSYRSYLAPNERTDTVGLRLVALN